MRHFLKLIARPVACVVIAAQLLLVVPSMAHAPDPGAITAKHCEEMPGSMSGTAHDDDCPCCPDGAGSLRDCLTMCSLAAAVAPSEFVVAVTPSHATPFVEYTADPTSLADPPLKPPPIA